MHLAGYPPRVKTLCRKLGIDFAEALVGFERRGGATIPAFDGVVVCAEHAAAVRRTFAAEEQCAALFSFYAEGCFNLLGSSAIMPCALS